MGEATWDKQARDRQHYMTLDHNIEQYNHQATASAICWFVIDCYERELFPEIHYRLSAVRLHHERSRRARGSRTADGER